MASTATKTKTPSNPPSQLSLSLPLSQFANLQPHPYLLAHLAPPPTSREPSARANGRAPTQPRAASANIGSLTHANGSAVVRIGETAAVCGVRAEVLSADDIPGWGVSSSGAKRRKTTDNNDSSSEIEDYNLLVPNLSLSTGCSPSYMPGAAPSSLAQSLSHQVLSLLHTTQLVRTEDLRIWHHPPNFSAAEREGEGAMDQDDDEDADETPEPEVKAFWTLYIDILIISLAGNPFDAAWAAVLAALRDTRLPRAWWDTDHETVVCSDIASEAKSLTLRGFPIASSYAVFEADAAETWRPVVPRTAQGTKSKTEAGTRERWILADPDGFEERLCQERICVVLDRDSSQCGKVKIISLKKNGGMAVGKEEMREIVGLSTARWEEWKAILDKFR
ncbi:hypothetical protein FQN54_002357 [Arachnomyces sp. PD_36]|nr:hypothetical protein FQN54_002357 [Arachnomyces sp. PD_36]